MMAERTLAQAVKAWRGATPAREAAGILGIPHRTLQGIELGRPFRYERLLRHALETMGPPQPDWGFAEWIETEKKETAE